ncbi:MAG: ABC transporter ATP-binding protein [Anaerolineales bacterium]|nr:ABC transporter ATP-binding protein [Anaerolineales bacterium]
MKNIVIDIQKLSKVYRIDTASGKSGSRTLQEDLKALIQVPLSRKRIQAKKEEVWALKDVSFQVLEGEVLGIIGRNGAGKSTLLKVLSRITEPSNGYADVYGRFGSLLEVGTGFHSELTGRENIYLSGAILGMRKAEIDRKYDEIVAFSGIEQYIDTPVKRYSSGMAVRLAFAVAAHLDPEILLIDEVLAVGDVAFQQKCLGKMSEVANSGRTILFVSHNMGAIKGLCSRAIWLDKGGLKANGEVDDVVQQYLVASSEDGEWLSSIGDRVDRSGNGAIRFSGFQMQDIDGNPMISAIAGEPVNLVLDYKLNIEDFQSASFYIWIRDAFLKGILNLSTSYTGQDFNSLEKEGSIVCRIPRFPLREGRYFLDLGVDVNGIKADRVLRAVPIDVINGKFYVTGKVPQGSNAGDFLCDHSWSGLNRFSGSTNV